MVFSPSGKQQTALIGAGTACAVLDIIVWSIGMMTYTPLCYLFAILFAVASTVALTLSYGIGTCKDKGKLLVKIATSALCLAILSALPAMSYVTLVSGSVGNGAAVMCAVFYICALVAFACVSTALDRMPDVRTTVTKVASDAIPMTDGSATTPSTSDKAEAETSPATTSEQTPAPESNASPSDSAAADSTQRKYPSGRFRMHMQVVDSDRSISGSNAHRVWFKEEGHSFYGQRTEGYVLLDSSTWEIIPKSRPITGNSNFYAMTYEDYDAYCKKNGIEPYPDGAFDEPEKDADGVIIGPAKSAGEKTEAGTGDGSEQAAAETVATKKGRLTPEELEALMREDLEKMTREVAFKRLQAIGVIDENGNPTYRFSDSDDGDDGSDTGDAAPNQMPEGKTIFTAEQVDEAMSGGNGDNVITDTDDDDGTTSDAKDNAGSDVTEDGAEDSKVPDASDGDEADVARETATEETAPDAEPGTSPETDAEPADEKPHYDADTQFLCEVVTACGECFTYPVSCGSVESIVKHENPELSFFSDRAFSEPVDWSALNPDNRTVYAKTTGRRHVLFLHVLDEDSEPIVRRLVVNDGKSLASVIRTPRQTNRGEFFEAWYSDAGLNRRMQLRRPVIGDMSLYAKYDAPVR